MLASEPDLNPPYDFYKEYLMPQKIEEVCRDILAHGAGTYYQDIYDAMWELAEGILIEEAEDDARTSIVI